MSVLPIEKKSLVERLQLAMQEAPYQVKFLILASAALAATAICFLLMFLLVTTELGRPTPQELVQIDAPLSMETADLERPEARKKPEKRLPTALPEGMELLPEMPKADISRSELPTIGSLADLLDLSAADMELSPPVKALVPMYVVRPTYPFKAVMKEIEGFVLVEFTVRENGTVVNPVVLASEPGDLFDDAALSAISKFKFQPREVGGDAIAAEGVQMRFAFKLDQYFSD